MGLKQRRRGELAADARVPGRRALGAWAAGKAPVRVAQASNAGTAARRWRMVAWLRPRAAWASRRADTAPSVISPRVLERFE